VIDGEAVVLGIDGISDFNALHSRKHDDEVQFCAFDILAEGGDDLRKLRYRCGRPISNGRWRTDPRASSSTRSSAA
jgi:bifunctional non-homologous end joining protein LigD